MGRAVVAGVAYFAVVFAVGFALGTIRTLWVAPRVGELPATVLELPLMLATSWIACGALVRRFAVPPRPADRVAMGAVAFALLMAGEAAVSLALGGLTLAEHVALYSRPAVLLGLAAQVLFAAFPLVRR